MLTAGTDFADATSSFRNGGLISSDFKFTGGNESVSGPAGTLGTADVLSDPSTSDNDVLTATLTANVAPIIQNIETLNLTVSAAGAGLNLANVMGAKAMTVTGVFDGTFTNIDGTQAPTITIKDYNKNLTASLVTAAGTGSSAESLKFVLNGTGSKAKLTLDTAAAGALETLSIESAGSAKNTLELVLDGTAPVINAINKTTITGAADLDAKVAHALINGQEVDASGHTGKFQLTIDRDTAGTATTNLTNVKGYDGLTLIDSTAGGDSLVLSGVTTGTTITLANAFAALAASIAVKGAASNTSDSLTLLLDHTTDATDINVNGSFDLTINDVETITIKSEGGTSAGNTIAQLVTSAGVKVKAEGGTKLNLGLKSAVSSIDIAGSGKHSVSFAAATAYGEGKNLTVDATGATSETTINLANFQGTAGGAAEKATVTGSAQKDTITGSSNANVQTIVDAGGGDDVVTVYTANAASAQVNLGAGADELKIDDVVGTKHVIISDFKLGSGGDKLSVNTAAAMTFGGVGAASAASQLVILNAAVANDTAAKTAADGTSPGERAIIVINNASGVAELWYDANGNGTANDAVKLAAFENITTVGVLTDATNGFIAANFGTWV